MTDNMLADFVVERMAKHHFEITSREFRQDKYPKNVVKAVRAVLVEGMGTVAASITFRVGAADLFAALTDYSETWAKYCEDNALIHNGFWLPTDMIPRARAIETRALNRVERLRKEKELASRQQKSSA